MKTFYHGYLNGRTQSVRCSVRCGSLTECIEQMELVLGVVRPRNAWCPMFCTYQVTENIWLVFSSVDKMDEWSALAKMTGYNTATGSEPIGSVVYVRRIT